MMAEECAKKGTALARWLIIELHMITAHGFRINPATVRDCVARCDVTSYSLPVPSGMVWAAWEMFIAVQPWEGTLGQHTHQL